jgi:hypothetical protein
VFYRLLFQGLFHFIVITYSMKKRRSTMLKKVFLIFVVAFLFYAETAQAEYSFLASWDQNGQPGNQEYTAGISYNPHITATILSRSGLMPVTGTNSFGSSSWSREGYVQFGLTVDPGYHVNLNTFNFVSTTSNSGPAVLAVRTSVNDYASNFYTHSLSFI